MARSPLHGCDFTNADISGLRINGQQATWQMLQGLGCKVSGIDLAIEKAQAEGRVFSAGTGISAAEPAAASSQTTSVADAARGLSGISGGEHLSVAALNNLPSPDTPATAMEQAQAAKGPATGMA